jgi:hypothetical protein
MYAKLYLNMKSALMLDEQSCRRQKPEEHVHISPQSPLQELTLEDISPKWASRLKSKNIPIFMSSTWLRWRYELQKTSKCVVGEHMVIPRSIPKTATNVTELVANFCITLH